MTARMRAGLATATLAAAMLLACGDPNAPVANFETFTDTIGLYALNGSPREAPTAISIVAGRGGTAAVTTNSLFFFDVAVDIDDQGRPVLYPVRTVAAPFLGRHRVGILRTTQPFETVLSAPRQAYTYDSVAVLSVGETVVIESADQEACTSLIRTGVVYGKLVVDSLRADTRQVFVRVTGNPNCGFRSFGPGIPTD